MSDKVFTAEKQRATNIASIVDNMRERFKTLQITEEGYDNPQEDVSEISAKDKPETHGGFSDSTKGITAAGRWNRIKAVVRSDIFQSQIQSNALLKQSHGIKNDFSSSSPVLGSSKASNRNNAISLEEIELSEYWTSVMPPNPFQQTVLSIPESVLRDEQKDLLSDLESDSNNLGLTVARIPAEIVEAEKEKREIALFDEQKKVIENIKRKEVDVIWREHQARQRVIELEKQSNERIKAEREKIADSWLHTAKKLGQEFRHVREVLEKGVKRQHAAVLETFGNLLIHEESISRKFQVFTKLIPQPVEFRIHVLRAVKTKLAKGSYAIMLTQYESLGGKPLHWSELGPTGIGRKRPGITRIFKHNGRYFDRTLRVEDSTFALCPPRVLIKPSFVFVLELFQLANRHNPTDRVVAWTAVPMSFETLSIIEGKIKLPLLKGEHQPGISNFRSMETLMAKDLDHWLCNIYIEVRHVPLLELGVSEEIIQSSEFKLDYFNKSVALMTTPHANKKQLEEKDEIQEIVSLGATKPQQSKGSNVAFMPNNQILPSVALDVDSHDENMMNDAFGVSDNNIDVKGPSQKQSAESDGKVLDIVENNNGESMGVKEVDTFLTGGKGGFKDLHPDNADKGIFRRKNATNTTHTRVKDTIAQQDKEFQKKYKKKASASKEKRNNGSDLEKVNKNRIKKKPYNTVHTETTALLPITKSTDEMEDRMGNSLFADNRRRKVSPENTLILPEVEDHENVMDGDMVSGDEELVDEEPSDVEVDTADRKKDDDYILRDDRYKHEQNGMLRSFWSLFGFSRSGGRHNTIQPSRNSSQDFKPHQYHRFANKKKLEHGSNSMMKKKLILSKGNSFSAHKSDLLKRWKEEHSESGNNRTASDEENKGDWDLEEMNPNHNLEVIERGYNPYEEVFLQEHQRGKLSGVEAIDSRKGREWAKMGQEGKIVRRWQAEGPRFDSEALETGDPVDGTNTPENPELSETKLTNGKSQDALQRIQLWTQKLEHRKLLAGKRPGTAAFNSGWEPLKDVREMQDYSMCVASDPSKIKKVVAGSIAKSKLRYLSVELFGDFSPILFGTLEFYMTIIIFTFALWMRIYVHYLAGYLFLQSFRTPVANFNLQILQISYKYSSSAISTSAEVGVVAIGPIANTIVFTFLVIFGAMFYTFARYLPDSCSKFFAAYGVATVLDPVLVILIDLIYHNYDCGRVSSACADNYLSSACDCFYGDFIKLWYRMDRIEGSGLTGLFIVLMLYIGTGIISSLILYIYLVHIHRDGRILDLWRRLNAPEEEFFIPDDFEISQSELKVICMKAGNWKSPKGTRRKISVVKGIEKDPDDENYEKNITRYIIYDVEKTGTTTVFRQFLKHANGMIVEIFQDLNGLVPPSTLPGGDGGDELLNHSLDPEDEKDNHGEVMEVLNDSEFRDNRPIQEGHDRSLQANRSIGELSHMSGGSIKVLGISQHDTGLLV